MKKKGWTSLTVKLNGLILIIVLVLSLGLAVFAYRVNSERVDKYYKQTTSQAAATVAAFVDGDMTEDLLNAIKTEEFAAVRDAAEDADGDQMWILHSKNRTRLEEAASGYQSLTPLKLTVEWYKEQGWL